MYLFLSRAQVKDVVLGLSLPLFLDSLWALDLNDYGGDDDDEGGGTPACLSSFMIMHLAMIHIIFVSSSVWSVASSYNNNLGYFWKLRSDEVVIKQNQTIVSQCGFGAKFERYFIKHQTLGKIESSF